MKSEVMFINRGEAGRRLAAVLVERAYGRPIVLGLPRGGVEVAAEVSLILAAPLDVLVARKIGAPSEPELAVGAVAPGVTVMDERFKLSPEVAENLARKERAEMNRRIRVYRSRNAGLPDVEGRSVIVVDDGLATGLTAVAAVRALKRQKPRRVVLAVPVGSREAIELLREEADEIVCLSVPEEFYAIGEWYADFTPVSDEDVLAILESSQKRPPPPGA